MNDEHDRPNPSDDASEGEKESKEIGPDELSAGDALKKGVGLLWQAAKTAADEVQREVDMDAARAGLRAAGKDLERAANEAARMLETFIDGAAKPRTPEGTDQWPRPDEANAQPSTGSGDEGTHPGGDIDQKATEKREFRIQVDDD